MKVLLTGGAGYIGATTALALESAGHTPIILDSLVTGVSQFIQHRPFYRGSVGDKALVRRIALDHPDIGATIHMAALTSVPESVATPAKYYRNNVVESLALFESLVSLDRTRIVFSSSASVYAANESFEVWESSPTNPASPYAESKLVTEQMLAAMAGAGQLSAISLRYFNPIGAEPGLSVGMHSREPSHVLGQLCLAASGRNEHFDLTGADLPTRDGTGIRDYIHVWDLAQAHVRAIESFDEVVGSDPAQNVVVNLGTGDGVTVRELIATFEKVAGTRISVRERPARPGDTVGAFANADKAAELLRWESKMSLEEAIASTLSWMNSRHLTLGYA